MKTYNEITAPKDYFANCVKNGGNINLDIETELLDLLEDYAVMTLKAENSIAEYKEAYIKNKQVFLTYKK